MKEMINILFPFLLCCKVLCLVKIYSELSIILQGTHLAYCSNLSKKEYLIHQQLQSFKKWNYVQKWLSLFPFTSNSNNLESSYWQVSFKSILLIKMQIAEAKTNIYFFKFRKISLEELSTFSSNSIYNELQQSYNNKVLELTAYCKCCKSLIPST